MFSAAVIAIAVADYAYVCASARDCNVTNIYFLQNFRSINCIEIAHIRARAHAHIAMAMAIVKDLNDASDCNKE